MISVDSLDVDQLWSTIDINIFTDTFILQSCMFCDKYFIINSKFPKQRWPWYNLKYLLTLTKRILLYSKIENLIYLFAHIFKIDLINLKSYKDSRYLPQRSL